MSISGVFTYLSSLNPHICLAEEVRLAELGSFKKQDINECLLPWFVSQSLPILPPSYLSDLSLLLQASASATLSLLALSLKTKTQPRRASQIFNLAQLVS